MKCVVQKKDIEFWFAAFKGFFQNSFWIINILAELISHFALL